MLDLPEGQRCVEVKFAADNKIEFRTSTSEDMTAADSLRGTMTFDPVKVTWMFEEVIRIYLPDGQLVIDPSTASSDGAGVPPWLLGPLVKNEEFGGTYVSADGTKSYKMVITTSPQALGFAGSRFSVELDGQWFFNIDFPY